MSTSFFMGVDFSTYGIRFARWKNRAENLAVCDVSKLPFNNGSFDVVVSEAVLHHLAFNFEAGVREIARVSRESLFISTLHYDHYDFLDMESVDTKYGKVFRSHYVGTDEYRMDELLRDCGFEISSAKIHTVIEKGSRVKDGIFVEAIRK
ncbi:MAG: methyltransferase domain-containing protein, partial [Candidatus Micrarchaeota archaeon]|nr:methyltransferase domain-containing protein [Candidatus Micrarchaeota archaeon]